jgi:hypothetical protein
LIPVIVVIDNVKINNIVAIKTKKLTMPTEDNFVLFATVAPRYFRGLKSVDV